MKSRVLRLDALVRAFEAAVAGPIMECPAPCGAIFRKTADHQVYCSPACSLRATRQKNLLRVQKYRREHKS